jgi:hypothetical protein
MTTNGPGAGPLHKTVEAGVTLAIALFGVIVIIGSVKAGINWGAEGPRAGFFPFYVGIAIVASSAVNLWNGLHEEDKGLFAEWGQLRQVLSVVVPTASPNVAVISARARSKAWSRRRPQRMLPARQRCCRCFRSECPAPPRRPCCSAAS